MNAETKRLALENLGLDSIDLVVPGLPALSEVA
ncbi:hypothetical protein CULC22_01695 [Corynebacterium ulcerans BR-AD22]|nr:hypothetical protein CULC22_01695 [Corynebacterium ulcerans BR-AD22]